jgi:polysaccharide biosynthesis/export protein
VYPINYFLILAALSTLVSSCSNMPGISLSAARRPQVMTGEAPDIIDYGAILDQGTYEEEEGREEEYEGTEPLTPHLYDPYDPLLKDFRFSVGDVLEISVFGEVETYHESVVIAPDGCLYYAFLDGIPVAGKNIAALTEELEKLLAKFFKNPKVTINLRSSMTLNWKVLGKVQKPGIYPFSEPITLRQAIGKAGGLSTEGYEYKSQNSDLEVLADLSNSFIIRNKKMLDIDFQKLIHTADPRWDIFLKPGDYIYIAEYEYREVYVLGNVRAATRVQYLQDMTLMQALANVGGWPIEGPYSADATNCLVIRGDLECPRIVRCNLHKIIRGEAKDFYLVPGDIIYVHNKPFRFARTLIRLALDAFIQSFATGAGSYYAQFRWFHINTVDDD